MPPNPYKVIKLDGLQQSRGRAVVFLECTGDAGIDAHRVYSELAEKPQYVLRTRFEFWIGNGKCDDYFHGWPNRPEYKDCFQFMWREGRVRCRLYGFLIHPVEKDPAFQVCVLSAYGSKTQHDTDKTILDLVILLSRNSQVVEAVRKAFAITGGAR